MSLDIECLIGHWKAVGLPGSCQFDNDTTFQGPHAHPDTLGRVTRLCLSPGVVPVFVPPREPGSQAIIEGYNGTWLAKVGARFEHADLAHLEGRSSRLVAAHRRHRADRIEAAPRRRAFPEGGNGTSKARPRGRIVDIRRTDASGRVELLNRRFEMDSQWLHRLARAEVDLDGGMVRICRLRRREPTEQPVLKQVPYRFPDRRFHDGSPCLFPVDCSHAAGNKRALTVQDVVSLATAWSVQCSGCPFTCPCSVESPSFRPDCMHDQGGGDREK